jgi:hypothetical protein
MKEQSPPGRAAVEGRADERDGSSPQGLRWGS